MASSRGSGNASCYHRGSALPPQETARSDDGAGVLAPRGTGDPPSEIHDDAGESLSEGVVGGASVVLELLLAAVVLCGGMPGGARGRRSRVAGGEGGGCHGGAREMEMSCPTDVRHVARSPSTAFMDSSTSCHVQG